MQRRTIGLATLFVVIISSLIVVNLADESDASFSSEDIVYLSLTLDSDKDDSLSVIGEFEIISEKVKACGDKGIQVKVLVDRSPKHDKELDSLIDHMINEIGRHYFAEKHFDKDHDGNHHGKGKIAHSHEEECGTHDVRFEEVSQVDESSIGTHDQSFVLDVIDFAIRNDMASVAIVLSNILNDNVMHLMRISNMVSAIDIHADGNEDDVEDSDFILIDDGRDPDLPMYELIESSNYDSESESAFRVVVLLEL